MIACRDLSEEVGTAAACRSMDIARATYYRHLEPAPEILPRNRPAPPRTLRRGERQEVLDVRHADRFVDRAPAEIYATLRDEGTYRCSLRTLYRVWASASEVWERRNQLRHPNYQAPPLLATAPHQVWSWDLTKLRGPAKWVYFHLYVILDIFSRYVVGGLLADQESAQRAERLIEESCQQEGIPAGPLTLPSDRGPAMASPPVALLLARLGITKTPSRPPVSNDHPFSESPFKTLKYGPEFPERCGSSEDATTFCRRFFSWYNQDHRHCGRGLMTPAMVQRGEAAAVTQVRKATLSAAFQAHPERFVRGTPRPPVVPAAAWINKPKTHSSTSEACPRAENTLIPRGQGDGIQARSSIRRHPGS